MAIGAKSNIAKRIFFIMFLSVCYLFDSKRKNNDFNWNIRVLKVLRY